MKGDLTLESLEGIGSTFTLTLPIASDISAAQPSEMAAPQQKNMTLRTAAAS
jgi:chemotaxis protein histidine kinase CheA